MLLLADIGLKLKSKETVDLDSRMSREQAESSTNLKIAEENELICVLHKDAINPITSLSFDPLMLLEMEKRIRDQITQEMKSAKMTTVAPVQQSSAEVQQLTDKISELISKIGNQPANNTTVSNEIDESIDTEKLFDVHAKALKRMTQGASGNVKAKQQTSQSDVNKIANELEDFLK